MQEQEVDKSKMSPRDFDEVCGRLTRFFGNEIYSKDRQQVLYGRIHKMTREWFETAVDGIILRQDRFFDFDKAVREEISKQNSYKKADDVSISITDFFKKHETDSGFQKAMAIFGAKDSIGAIENCKKMKSGLMAQTPEAEEFFRKERLITSGYGFFPGL